MTKLHNLGFPRIGKQRELKFALENYWRGDSDLNSLENTAKMLRKQHWQIQQAFDYVPVGDFSLYDHVLDTSFLVGNVPARASSLTGEEIDRYFRIARGRGAKDSDSTIHAGEMTKWFDTNYHYIVPEFTKQTRFALNEQRLIEQIKEAQAQNIEAKPVLLGPVTYLWLGKEKDQTQKLDLLPQLTQVYLELLTKLAELGIDWLQIDEPIVVTELTTPWQQALISTYNTLASANVKLLFTSYFGPLKENLPLVAQLPVAGIHVDCVTDSASAKQEVDELLTKLSPKQVLSLGVVNGRNIWKTNLTTTLDWLEPIAQQLGEQLWLAPSCSLLHVPVDLNQETQLDTEIKSWLAFAEQKCQELHTLQQALNNGRASVEQALAENFAAINNRKASSKVHNPKIQAQVEKISPEMALRKSPFASRANIQKPLFSLPNYPTTTIGSFPQTNSIRKIRRAFKKGDIDLASYESQIKAAIEQCVDIQHQLDLDVLVHGEAERNDMVEYFGEQLAGYAFSELGWVQSYGSRCVKPPILFGDISRTTPMTVAWSQYAQSLTSKPMKGMLTGPVTILNWSFVRDDQPLATTCKQLALAIRQETLDLEQAGINIIQIDEAALREGLPLRKSQWQEYLAWAINAFKISANGVKDETQIHTHMCYSNFNDIIAAIADMDADVITIETSRSDMELLDIFEQFDYPNDIGPGVYDIHSPNIPAVEQMVNLIKKAQQRIPAERLWLNPDCGLKTRAWAEVKPALANMVTAAKALRQTEPATV